MCPFCVSSTALVVAGVASAGGVTALAGLTLKKLRPRSQPRAESPNESSGDAVVPAPGSETKERSS
jgi:hypothetical protein